MNYIFNLHLQDFSFGERDNYICPYRSFFPKSLSGCLKLKLYRQFVKLERCLISTRLISEVLSGWPIKKKKTYCIHRRAGRTMSFLQTCFRFCLCFSPFPVSYVNEVPTFVASVLVQFSWA